MDEQNWSGVKNLDVLNYLQARRSLSVKYMNDTAPSREEVDLILKTAARVPDHGKLNPWYFVVFEGDKREKVGSYLREAYKLEDPEASEAKLDLEAQRFMRAPMVIMVVSRMRKAKHPIWEQFLSAGAVCQNLLLASNALGYAGNWLTEWYSFNPVFREKMGLDERDNIAGVIYLGKPDKQPEGRPRPNMDDIVTYWDIPAVLNKGDAAYDKDKYDLPPTKLFGIEDL